MFCQCSIYVHFMYDVGFCLPGDGDDLIGFLGHLDLARHRSLAGGEGREGLSGFPCVDGLSRANAPDCPAMGHRSGCISIPLWHVVTCSASIRSKAVPITPSTEIDFEEAQRLWLDERMLVIPVRREAMAEPRWLAIGLIETKCWSVVFTLRDDTVRIISARRARKEEVALYDDEDV